MSHTHYGKHRLSDLVMLLLDDEMEDWIGGIVGKIMGRYEKAGTPIRGGAPIAEALREAYKRGREAE